MNLYHLNNYNINKNIIKIELKIINFPILTQ